MHCNALQYLWRGSDPILMFQKFSIAIKCCSSELSIHQYPKKRKKETFNNNNNNNNNNDSCFLSTKSYHIKMISEGSCDTEDGAMAVGNLL